MLPKNLIMAACGIAFCCLATSAQAVTVGESGDSQPSVSIANNSGGNIASFAVEAASYRNAGTMVRFSGRCDSACTLFLGLPTIQTCVSQGAYFRFHSPSAGSARSEHIAQNYLMRKYPGWVRNWIAQHNGLSHQLITMDYSTASQHMQTCNSFASQ